jgi:hypothetical protein
MNDETTLGDESEQQPTERPPVVADLEPVEPVEPAEPEGGGPEPIVTTWVSGGDTITITTRCGEQSTTDRTGSHEWSAVPLYTVPPETEGQTACERRHADAVKIAMKLWPADE